MKLRNLVASLGLLASTLAASNALAYPIDPVKTPVEIPQDPEADSEFTLAYDTDNPNTIYYAPKRGRVAKQGNMPIVGFAMLPTGGAYMNAMFEFGVFGADKERLFRAIRNAGKTPVAWPFRKTKIIPQTPGFENGGQVCREVLDPVTEEMVRECDETSFTEVKFAAKGPTLGENIAVTMTLNAFGALVYRDFMRQGAALFVDLEGEYLAAGTAFEALVRIKYDFLFESFRSYASFHGMLCTDIQVETFFENETYCQGRPPSECGVWIEYTDLNTGRRTNTATIDPDNEEEHKGILVAANNLARRLRDTMLTPITRALGPLDKSRPTGFKLDAKFERQHRGMDAQFSFKSARGVVARDTTITAPLGCVILEEDGDIRRHTDGDCASYWR